MKAVKNYTDYGFGFPIVIDRVEMGNFEGEEVPLFNLNELEDRVIKALPDRVIRLTGNEVRFVRLHFGLTLDAFGKCLGVTHAAVKQWEKKYNEPTGMEWAKEKNLRLFILRSVGCSDQEFVRLFDALESGRPATPGPLRITMEQWQPYSCGNNKDVAVKMTGVSVRVQVCNRMPPADLQNLGGRAHGKYVQVQHPPQPCKGKGTTDAREFANAA